MRALARVLVPLLCLACAVGCGGSAGSTIIPPDAEAGLLQAAQALQAGDLETAKRLLETLLARHPDVVRAHVLLGQVYLWYGTRVAHATARFERALELDPRDVQALHWLGRARYSEGRREEARRAFERAVELDPKEGGSWLYLGMLASQEGRPDEARGLLTKAAEFLPLYADPHVQLALLAEREGDRAKAIDELRTAVRLEPMHVAARFHLGQVLVREGSEDGARQLRIHALLDELQDFPRPERREPLMRRILALEPDNDHVLVSLGDLVASEGRIEEAISCYEEAARVSPGNRFARERLRALHRTTGSEAGATREAHPRENTR